MAKANVMIVEDESIVSMAIGEKLNKLGYEVVGTPASGVEAVEAAGNLNPDLVLMDISLEGSMDGVEAASIIRRNFSIPVIYLTAYTDGATVDRAKWTSPAGYLVKPCSERDMKIALEIAMHRDSPKDDMTAREQFFKHLFESAGDWVFAKDGELKYLYMNPAMRNDLGLEGKQAQGATDKDIFPAELAEKFEILDRRALSGQTVETEHCLVLNELYVSMDMMRTPLRSETGSVEGLCGIGRTVGFDTGGQPPRVSDEQWNSEAMLMTMERIRLAACADTPCLITGEPGVGKSHYALVMNMLSNRASEPFNTLNCAALDAEALELKLFGAEFGSCALRGILETSEGGTCHLKQIERLPMQLQKRLLEYLKASKQTPEKSRPGVRLVASCSENIQVRVSSGDFNKELYYMLNFNTIRIPPLRERKADIPALCGNLMEIITRELGFPEVPSVGQTALKDLMAEDWPGNIRELKSALEKIALRGENESIKSLDRERSSKGSSEDDRAISFTVNFDDETSLPDLVADLKRRLIAEGLERSHGSVTRAAKLLGVSRDSFNYMVKALGVKK